VMDWFSRRVLAWRVSITMDTAFCVEASQEALDRHGYPEIHCPTPTPRPSSADRHVTDLDRYSSDGPRPHRVDCAGKGFGASSDIVSSMFFNTSVVEEVCQPVGGSAALAFPSSGTKTPSRRIDILPGPSEGGGRL
jgi:hypothetical protein